MGQTKTTIELNGKQYDIKTGSVLEQPSTVVHAKPTPQAKGVILDGFTRRPGAKKPAVAHQKAVAAAATHHRTQKSQTLVRAAVPKPTPSVPSVTSLQTAASVLSSSIGLAKDKARRFQRAQTVAKSSLISKFGDDLPKQVVKKVEHLPVAVRKMHEALDAQKPASQIIIEKAKGKNIFEQAIDNAISPSETYKEPKQRGKLHKKLRSKTFTLTSAVLVTVVVGGFMLSQYLPEISVRFAAARAGLSAGLPKYQPTGFDLKGPIEYSAGKVAVNFKANADDRGYKVTQQTSNWNSQALMTNFVTAKNHPYQTYQDKGKTIYIYDNSNATWVDGGVWYQIEGNANLTSDQLLRIADSL